MHIAILFGHKEIKFSIKKNVKMISKTENNI